MFSHRYINNHILMLSQIICQLYQSRNHIEWSICQHHFQICYCLPFNMWYLARLITQIFSIFYIFAIFLITVVSCIKPFLFIYSLFKIWMSKNSNCVCTCITNKLYNSWYRLTIVYAPV